MGAGLVTAAYEVASRVKLDHAPTRVFVYMANTALDSHHEPTFWRGRDALATALGKSGAAGHRAVGRALETLTAAGVVKCAQRSAPGGRNARYVLLDGRGAPLRVIHNGGRSPSPVEVTEDADRPANGGHSAPNGGRSGVGTEDAHRPVEEEEDHQEEGAPESRSCPSHPNGTDQPCGACRDARERYDAAHGKDSKSVSLHLVTVQPGRHCAPGTHKFVDDGTCLKCDIRPLEAVSV